jgi:dTDP-D-glucose 4,6-dehydratase
MANAMLSLAENANAVGVFNVGFGHSNQIMHMQANISKLYQQTGWQPKVSLQDTIAQTVEWFRKN